MKNVTMLMIFITGSISKFQDGVPGQYREHHTSVVWCSMAWAQTKEAKTFFRNGEGQQMTKARLFLYVRNQVCFCLSGSNQVILGQGNGFHLEGKKREQLTPSVLNLSSLQEQQTHLLYHFPWRGSLALHPCKSNFWFCLCC